MGTYVFALNTKIHTISNVTLGVAEYRYKPSMSDRDDFNQRAFNRTCARRVAHFQNSKLPFFFVMYRLAEGIPVFSHLSQEGYLVGSCFDDGVALKKVGILTKVGRSWTIKFD